MKIKNGFLLLLILPIFAISCSKNPASNTGASGQQDLTREQYRPEPQMEQQVIQEAGAAAASFFSERLACVKEHYGSKSAKALSADCPAGERVQIEIMPKAKSQKNYDLYFCSATVPQSVQIERTINSSPDHAVSYVNENFGTYSGQYLVDLKKLDGQWKITNINCPQ